MTTAAPGCDTCRAQIRTVWPSQAPGFNQRERHAPDPWVPGPVPVPCPQTHALSASAASPWRCTVCKRQQTAQSASPRMIRSTMHTPQRHGREVEVRTPHLPMLEIPSALGWAVCAIAVSRVVMQGRRQVSCSEDSCAPLRLQLVLDVLGVLVLDAAKHQDACSPPPAADVLVVGEQRVHQPHSRPVAQCTPALRMRAGEKTCLMLGSDRNGCFGSPCVQTMLRTSFLQSAARHANGSSGLPG